LGRREDQLRRRDVDDFFKGNIKNLMYRKYAKGKIVVPSSKKCKVKKVVCLKTQMQKHDLNIVTCMIENASNIYQYA
jgi:hypothetical protein